MGTKQYDSATDLLTFTRASGGTALRKISYGNELVTNGTFDTNTTGWAGNNSYYSPTIESQRLKVFTGASVQWNYAQTSVSGLTIGKSYRFQASSFVGTSTRHRISLGTVSGQSDDIYGQGLGVGFSQTVDTTFTATTTVVYVGLQNTDGVNGSTTFFDNVSIKEVLFDQADGTLQTHNHSNNVPRIEYDATGAVKGLLIEEARTNLYLNSSDTSTNSSFGITKTSDSAVSPDGTTTADLITPDTSYPRHLFQYSSSYSAGDGSVETYSFYAKSNGYNLIEVSQRNQGGGTVTKFDLSAVTATTTGGTEIFKSIEDVGNGWYRCSAAYITSSVRPYPAIEFLDTDGSQGFVPDGTSGIYFWGHQLEAGAFPTSYIPTSGSTATRARDLAEIPTSAFGYNNDQGSLVVDVLTPVVDQFMILAYFNTTSYFNSRGFVKANTSTNSSGNHYVNATFHDGVSTKLQLGTQTQAEYTKLGLSYGDNDKAVRDGGTVLSGTSLSPSPTRLHIGGRENGLQSQCWIKSIKYYPRRLTNTQLQELTT
jgi:hypothetical protein